MWLPATTMRLHDAATGTTPDANVPWYQQIIPLIGQGLQVWNQQQVMDWYRQQVSAGNTPSQSVLQSMLQMTTPGVQVGLSTSTQNIVIYALMGVGVFAGLYLLTKSSGGARKARA